MLKIKGVQIHYLPTKEDLQISTLRVLANCMDKRSNPQAIIPRELNYRQDYFNPLFHTFPKTQQIIFKFAAESQGKYYPIYTIHHLTSGGAIIFDIETSEKMIFDIKDAGRVFVSTPLKIKGVPLDHIIAGATAEHKVLA
jgi:hypothetical protein